MNDILCSESASLQLLGEIDTHITRRSARAEAVAPGGHVTLERATHGKQAAHGFRVLNGKDRPVGSLPRRTGQWLAPLVDADHVRLDAYVPAAAEPGARLPLRIAVFATPGGLARMERPETDTDLDLSRAMAHWAYVQAQRLRDPELIGTLSRRVRAALPAPVPPEAQLWLALLPALAREAQTAQGFQALVAFRELLDRAVVGAPLHYRNLTLFPLSWPNDAPPPYELLDDALERRQAEIGEVDADGHVPQLKVCNRAARPLLIPEGSILVGAKQNRMVNLTVLVAAQSEFHLPVSCVEQGRWHARGVSMQAAACAPPSLRTANLGAVQRNRREQGRPLGDQHGVWSGVAQCLHRLDAHSATASLTDGLAAAETRLQPYTAGLAPPAGTAGAVLVRGGTVVGVELFDSTHTFSRLWPRRAPAYYLDALDTPDGTPSAAPGVARRFLAQLADCARPRLPAMALGNELELSSPATVGAALLYHGRLCHLSAFTLSG